ncbi:uncharacterized protein PGTG_20674 [Puccinia graminis f. sp. tritici CRL 75-36-700-3]|uniref:Uncharacterized protein n=1 Tax=Puccinia graminis f. sp. tritici (strain CRL 75-36-700-3 / race SCCL) TaxID=418459 RepID=H6QPC4_PUCGT|nr:uncharacterized protein PGTG_20674 [Puccinia graminis f. sp. tritici CRL 75-36-700-3]EHS63580.1 hypothetical protein PGTG_20674 [Puccinia graminis f. sp. tritici CRL 75-36-700-3]
MLDDAFSLPAGGTVEDTGQCPTRRGRAQPISSGGIPPDEMMYIQSRWEESLRSRWCTSRLVGRDSSRQAAIYTSSPGGIPPDHMVYNPARHLARWDETLQPTRLYSVLTAEESRGNPLAVKTMFSLGDRRVSQGVASPTSSGRV